MVDLLVVIVLYLVGSGHVGALLCGVAVGLDSHYHPTVGWHSLAIKPLLAKTYVIVHASSIVSLIVLYNFSILPLLANL